MPAKKGAAEPAVAPLTDGRLAALTARLGELGRESSGGDGKAQAKPIDALIVTALPNIRYLTGFTGSSALLLIEADSAILFTDPRYTLQAAQEVAIPVRIATGSLIASLAAYVKRRKCRRVAFERNRIGFEAWETLRAGLPPSCELVPVQSAVEELRMVKSPAEILLIRESVDTNSRALRRALKSLRPAMREAELAAEIDYQARRAGAEAPAFETIVASGERSARPHARPSSARIGEKTMLLIDMGAFQNGYASDMTRTMFMGKASKRFRAMYRAVLEAQLAAIEAVRPGVTGAQVDRAARAVLQAQGFGKEFVHSTGHGLGLEIHEGPRIGKKSETRLEAGFVITIEPGAYVDGFGGVRIEDTVAVTETGHEVLTGTSKELMEW